MLRSPSDPKIETRRGSSTSRCLQESSPNRFLLMPGDDKTALDSVYSLFATTREILRRRGRGTIEFSKIAIPVLNQVVRPFTAKWHRESLAGAFDAPQKRAEFRNELAALQADLRNYNRMLADIAEVEDLTDLERAN